MDRNKDLDALENSTVYDSENKKVGPVGQIYLDGRTNEPKFVTVNTGLFGTRESFVPYDAANHTADGLSVPFTKDFIKDAPNVDADGPLVAEDQQRIFDYYQSHSGATAGAQTQGTQTQGTQTRGGQTQDNQRQGAQAPGTQTRGAQTPGVQTQGAQRHGAQTRGSERQGVRAADTQTPVARTQGTQADNAGSAGTGAPSAGTDASGNVDSAAEVTAREERLKVGTEQREAGQVRLRKRVRTEHQNIEVPVKREELVIERENVDPDSPEARATGGIAGEGDTAEETVTLREERPVVNVETVVTEKVNVGKRTVQDTETVEGDLRKEEIDVEDQDRPETRRR